MISARSRVPPERFRLRRTSSRAEGPGEAEESLCSVKCILTEARERTRPLQCRFTRGWIFRQSARARAREKLASVEINRHSSVNLIFKRFEIWSGRISTTTIASISLRPSPHFRSRGSRQGSFRSRESRYFPTGTRSLRLIELTRVFPGPAPLRVCICVYRYDAHARAHRRNEGKAHARQAGRYNSVYALCSLFSSLLSAMLDRTPVGVGRPCDVAHCNPHRGLRFHTFHRSLAARESRLIGGVRFVQSCHAAINPPRLPLRRRADYNAFPSRDPRAFSIHGSFSGLSWAFVLLGDINQALFIARTFAPCIPLGLMRDALWYAFSAFASTSNYDIYMCTCNAHVCTLFP